VNGGEEGRVHPHPRRVQRLQLHEVQSLGFVICSDARRAQQSEVHTGYDKGLGVSASPPTPRSATPAAEPELFIDQLLVRIHFIIVMMRWTGLAPWESQAFKIMLGFGV